MSTSFNILKFFNRFILETADDAWFSYQRILQRFGVDRRFNYEIYKQSDKIVYDLLKRFYNIEIFGSEHIPENTRGIVCCNHQSLLDPLVFGVGVTHYTNRRLNIMAKVELFEIPIINAWIRTHFAFPVRRGKKDTLSYNRAKELLEMEELVGIFPEGTINNGNGRFLEPKTGAVRLSYETNSVIIPMCIYGTDKIYGKGAKYPRTKGKIVVKFDKPIHHNDIFRGDPSNPKFYKKAINRVMRKIRNLYWDAHEYIQKNQSKSQY
ncbi:MAG: lysophospholipid acyltransferase family protein [Promethearchaeota archaeon]